VTTFSRSDYDAYTHARWNDSILSFEDITVRRTRHDPRFVSQLDLPATLSLWLGLPLPASNIGRLIPELFLSPKLAFSFPGTSGVQEGTDNCDIVDIDINSDNDVAQQCSGNVYSTISGVPEEETSLLPLVDALFQNSMQVHYLTCYWHYPYLGNDIGCILIIRSPIFFFL
jgi:hypothetical protein